MSAHSFSSVCTAADIERSILKAVAYADVFDYPLTSSEIGRYLVGAAAPQAPVDAALDGFWLRSRLTQRAGFFALAGRESIVETRRERAAHAASLWPRAVRYGRVIGRLPYVRMVAVTGALAVDNVAHNADIDYLIVTQSTRLWLCRAAIIALVRAAARWGDLICPNYFVSDRTLAVDDRNLFTAHELVQMVPITGQGVYLRMRELNDWTRGFLPNANGAPRAFPSDDQPSGSVRTLLERAGNTWMGDRLERWEMERKVRRFTRAAHGHPEALFSADHCKGHFHRHGGRVGAAFEERLRALDL
jgi:hypothetical protein